MTFYKLDNGNVRQHGEISTDDGNTFINEYHLEYRKKSTPIENEIQSILASMETEYNKGNFETIANFYSKNGKVIGKNTEISGESNLKKYWKSFENYAGSWKLTNLQFEKVGEIIWQKGVSEIKDNKKRTHKVNFTLVFIKENNQWKIFQDSYW